MLTMISVSMPIDIDNKNANRKRGCLQNAQKRMRNIVQNDKNTLNLLTLDPNICYNKLAMVRVEIFGSGCVDCANNQHSLYLFMCCVRIVPPSPIYQLYLYYSTTYMVLSNVLTLYAALFVFPPIKLWDFMSKVTPFEPFVVV